MKRRNYKVSYIINGIEMSFIKRTTEKAVSKAIREIVKRLANAENQGYARTGFSVDNGLVNGVQFAFENGKTISFEIKILGSKGE